MEIIHSLQVSVFILIRELAVNHCLSISSSSTMFIFRKSGSSSAFFQMHYKYLYRILAAIHSFNDIAHFSDICKFAAIQFWQRSFFHRISEHQSSWNKFLIEAAVFSEQHRLYWKESSGLKQLLFRRIFSEYPVFWSTYFFLITSHW